MALIDKLFGKNKTLSELTRQELRREEILIAKQRDRLMKKISDAADAKQKLFKQGAESKSPELRKALAQDFEMKTQEQLLSARELTIRGKELLTVSRLRMLRENENKGKALGRLKLAPKDAAKITELIEREDVSQEMYLEQLDELLEIGTESDRAALINTTLGEPGHELMDIWADLDRGSVKDDEAFAEADKAVRQRQISADTR
ncbi:MAG: hypothetical protein AAF656_07645 [Planctomycetota bacterium]